MGLYDSNVLKFAKETQAQTSSLVKEWADILLFCKALSVPTDANVAKHKVQDCSVQPAADEPKTYTPERNKSVESVPESVKESRKPVEGEQMSLPLNKPAENDKKAAPAVNESDPAIPKALRDLMTANQVDEWDIQNVVSAKGYFHSDVRIRDYPEDFIMGVLVEAWDQVYAMIVQEREKMEIPFNN